MKKARDNRGKSSRPTRENKTLQLDAELESENSDLDLSLFYTATPRPKPIEVSFQLEGQTMTMEIDTGATLSIMSEHTYKKLWPDEPRPQIKPSTARLTTHTGEKIHVVGVCLSHAARVQAPPPDRPRQRTLSTRLRLVRTHSNRLDSDPSPSHADRYASTTDTGPLPLRVRW